MPGKAMPINEITPNNQLSSETLFFDFRVLSGEGGWPQSFSFESCSLKSFSINE